MTLTKKQLLQGFLFITAITALVLSIIAMLKKCDDDQ